MRFKDNGDAEITLSRDDYNSLIFALGYAMGAAMKENETKMANSFIALVNRINEGNPDYIPYKVTQ
jgi:hypothetical protein